MPLSWFSDKQQIKFSYTHPPKLQAPYILHEKIAGNETIDR